MSYYDPNYYQMNKERIKEKAKEYYRKNNPVVKRQKKPSLEDVALFLRRYKGNVNQVGRVLKCSPHTVSKVIKENDLGDLVVRLKEKEIWRKNNT